MKLIPTVITKRKVNRTVYLPDYGQSWRELPSEKKYFRFEADRTVYRRGQLTIVFNLDGYAIEGWSYWTCIFAWSDPCEDFPKGRLIFNDTGYGSTTGKHINQMDDHFYAQLESYKVERTVYHTVYRERVVPCDWSDNKLTVRSRATRRYFTTREVITVHPWMQRLDQIGWGLGVTPAAMRHEVKTMSHHANLGERWRAAHEQSREWDRTRDEREAQQREFERQRGIELGHIVELKGQVA